MIIAFPSLLYIPLCDCNIPRASQKGRKEEKKEAARRKEEIGRKIGV
jgi:hypothetical protein